MGDEKLKKSIPTHSKSTIKQNTGSMAQHIAQTPLSQSRANKQDAIFFKPLGDKKINSARKFNKRQKFSKTMIDGLISFFNIENKLSEEFSDNVIQAIAKFQFSNSFEDDGKIGESTLLLLSRKNEEVFGKELERIVEKKRMKKQGISINVVERIRNENVDLIIEEVAKKHNINPNIIRGIIAAESGGKVRTGANTNHYKGLMQSKHDKSHLDARTSIEHGIKKYIRYQIKMEKKRKHYKLKDNSDEGIINMTMVAYNAGPATVEKALEYANKDGKVEEWLDNEKYYVRAILYYGAFAISTIGNQIKKLEKEKLINLYRTLSIELTLTADTDIETWKKKRIVNKCIKLLQEMVQVKFKSKKDWSISEAETLADGWMLKAARFKHKNVKEKYLNTVLKYKNFFDLKSNKPVLSKSSESTSFNMFPDAIELKSKSSNLNNVGTEKRTFPKSKFEEAQTYNKKNLSNDMLQSLYLKFGLIDESPLFSEILFEAVINFQIKEKLDIDGKIGRKTLNALRGDEKLIVGNSFDFLEALNPYRMIMTLFDIPLSDKEEKFSGELVEVSSEKNGEKHFSIDGLFKNIKLYYNADEDNRKKFLNKKNRLKIQLSQLRKEKRKKKNEINIKLKEEKINSTRLAYRALRILRVESSKKLVMEISSIRLKLLSVKNSEIRKKGYIELNKYTPFNYQIINANILHKYEGKSKKNVAGKRTCNITVLSMILQALGKTQQDYKFFNSIEMKKIAQFYNTELSEEGDNANFSFPDFLQLVVIHYSLESEITEESINKARNKAAQSITKSIVLMKIIAQFGTTVEYHSHKNQEILNTFGKVSRGVKNRSKKTDDRVWDRQIRKKDSLIKNLETKEEIQDLMMNLNSLDVENIDDYIENMKIDNGKKSLMNIQNLKNNKKKIKRLRKWKNIRLKKLNIKLAKHHSGSYKDMQTILSIDVYKKNFLKKVEDALSSGFQVFVNLYYHFVRLQSIEDDGFIIDDPGKRKGNSFKVTWDEAIADGYFKRYQIIRP